MPLPVSCLTVTFTVIFTTEETILTLTQEDVSSYPLCTGNSPKSYSSTWLFCWHLNMSTNHTALILSLFHSSVSPSDITVFINASTVPQGPLVWEVFVSDLIFFISSFHSITNIAPTLQILHFSHLKSWAWIMHSYYKITVLLTILLHAVARIISWRCHVLLRNLH